MNDNLRNLRLALIERLKTVENCNFQILDMLMDRLETEEELSEMITYIDNNPGCTIFEINYQALVIVSDRWGINV